MLTTFFIIKTPTNLQLLLITVDYYYHDFAGSKAWALIGNFHFPLFRSTCIIVFHFVVILYASMVQMQCVGPSTQTY